MSIYSIIDLFNLKQPNTKFILIDNINLCAFEVHSADAENETIRGSYRDVEIDDNGNFNILKTFETENVTLTKYDCKKFDFCDYELLK